jgi:DNA-binding winged helix-turn-helix (wHTH) protein
VWSFRCCLQSRAIEITGHGQHVAVRSGHEARGNRAEGDTSVGTSAAAADDDQAGADLGRDVVELLEGSAAAQDGPYLHAMAVASHQLGQPLVALTTALFVEAVIDTRLTDVDQGDPGALCQGQPDGKFEGLFGVVAEVGADHQMSKRLHEPTMPTAPVHCCWISVGSGAAASNQRWTRRPTGFPPPRLQGRVRDRRASLMVSFPPFRLDIEEGRLWKGGTLLALRRKPFAILRYLVEHPKKLVTHEELIAEVWRGAVVSESAMRSHLHELRQVLGEGVIETVIGRGYRFVVDLRDEVATPAPLAPPAVAAPDPLVVGRDDELARLQAALERAQGGRRQLCFITGEPGIGKSTLVRTFLAGLDPGRMLIARGSCFEQHSTPEPYLAIIEALGGLVGSARGPEVLAALVRYAPTFVAQVPHLVSDEQLAEVTRRAAFSNQSRQLRELSEALEVLSAQDPLVLVLEDLQWSDVATIDLLSSLGQREARAKLLIIGTSRHAEIQRPNHPLNHAMRSLVARSGALELRLSKIAVASVQNFIDKRFAGHTFPQSLTDLVAKVTDGTPLYLVSLLDELAGRGMLAPSDGTWILTVPIEEVQAHRPSSVKQLIDMQLDRLPPAEQRVLEAASVVGAEFSVDLVAAALEQPAEQIDDVCDSFARRALFLRAETNDRYGVTHALVQEVCLERSSPARRQRWHRLVAEAIERDPRASESAHLLAKHFDAGGEPARAISSYLAAARQASARYAGADAVTLCARALDLVPTLPPGRERDLLELEVLSMMCQEVNSNSFSAAFVGRDASTVYRRAIEIARSLDDPSLLYAALTRACNYNMVTARYDHAKEVTAELERLEQAHDLDPVLLHAGIFARGYIAFFRAELDDALRLFTRLVPPENEPSPFHANRHGRALALGHLACVHWVVGKADRALEEAFATIAVADKTEAPILQALAHVVRARLRYLRRDPLSIIDDEMPQALRLSSLDLGLYAEVSAVALWAQARRAPLTLAAIGPMIERLEQRLKEVATSSTFVAMVLIDVLQLSGHLPEARSLTDEIIAFATAHSEHVYLPELLRMRGGLRERADPRAGDDCREAIELARLTGARSLEQRAIDSYEALKGHDAPGSSA